MDLRCRPILDGESIADKSRRRGPCARHPQSDFWSNSEIPVRELAELAFANWIAARSFCADERERSEWALLADLILKRARKIVESWTAASERAASSQLR